MSGSITSHIRDHNNIDMTILKYRIETAISHNQSVVLEEVT